MTTALAVKQEQLHRIETLYEGERGAKLQSALPHGVDLDRMKRFHLAAFAENPDLAACSIRSIALAIQQLCLLNWELGGPAPMAYLVPYKKECKMIPSYRGLLNLARRAKSVKSLVCDVVREGDEFQMLGGLLDRTVVHEKADQRGACTHVYAGFKLTNGEQVWEIWTAAQVDAHKDKYSPSAKSKDSAWSTNWEAMAKKTVLKRPLLDGRIELSIEDLRMVADETELMDGEPVRAIEPSLLDHDPDAVLDQSPPADDASEFLRHINEKYAACADVAQLDKVDLELHQTFGADEEQQGLLMAAYAARREELGDE